MMKKRMTMGFLSVLLSLAMATEGFLPYAGPLAVYAVEPAAEQEILAGTDADEAGLYGDFEYVTPDGAGRYSNKVSISIDGNNADQYTLEEAVKYALEQSGSAQPIISLNEDIYVEKPVVIKKGKPVWILLNGHTVGRSSAGIQTSPIQDGNIFKVEKDATLIISGGKLDTPVKANLVDQNGTHSKQCSSYEYSTGRIIGGLNSEYGGAIYAAAGSTVDLRDLTIANCMADYGGAIYADSQVYIKLQNTALIANKTVHDGGAIYINGSKSIIEMDNESHIDYNESVRNGGALYLNYSSISVLGGGSTRIGNNWSGGNGGAIYNAGSSNKYVGLKLQANYAKTYGGGIYSSGSGASFSNAEILDNKASCGGGIYIAGAENGIRELLIEHNSLNKKDGDGGGVFVESKKNIGLSGLLTIRDNYDQSGSKNNLCLFTDDNSMAFLDPSGVLATDSEVYLHTNGNPENRRITANPGNYDMRNFFMDPKQSGYHVEYINDEASGQYRHLVLLQGPSAAAGATEITVNYDEWKNRDITKDPSVNTFTETTDGAGYPVYAGYVSSSSHTRDNHDIVNKYYYSDGFFFSDPKIYNPHIATFGLNMAMAGANSYIKGHEDYRYKFDNIKSLYRQIGISENDIYINDWYTKKPTDDSIGAAIGKKRITSVAQGDYTLVSIAIRGDGYEREWASNMTVNGDNTKGLNDEHSGFKSARKQVADELEYFIKNYDLSEELAKGRVRFFVTGYSRSSAVANLTGKYLVDTYGEYSVKYKENPNTVYAYCYAVPAGGTDACDMSLTAENSEGYYCIHNVLNKADPVPMVAPFEMGFKRYGVDHYMPGSDAGSVASGKKPQESGSPEGNVTLHWDNTPYYVGSSEYINKRKVMLEQLLSVNDEFDFFDYFKEYYLTMGPMNFLKGNGAYSFNKADSDKKLEYWLPELYQKAQTWSLLSDSMTLTRDSYSNFIMREGLDNLGSSDSTPGNDWYNNGTSLQTALSGLTEIMLSKTDSEMSELTAAIKSVMDKFPTSIFSSGNTLLTLYYDLIGNNDGWDKGRDVQQKWLDDIWSKLNDGSHGQKSIKNAMSPEELDNFKKYYPTIMGLAFRVVKNDYDNAKKIDSSTAEQMWLIGTLVKNSEVIIQGHIPEVALAWLRSYDSYYSQDTRQKCVYTGSTQTPVVPSVSAVQGESSAPLEAGREFTGDVNIFLDCSGENENTIYYTLSKGNKTSQPMLYEANKGITIKAENNPVDYRLEAYSVKGYAEKKQLKNGRDLWTKNWKESEKVTGSFTVRPKEDPGSGDEPGETEKPVILYVYEPDIILAVEDGKGFTWQEVSDELPDEVTVLTDDDSYDSLPVVWSTLVPEGFEENSLKSQDFFVKGMATVPEGVDVYGEDDEGGYKPEHIGSIEVEAYVCIIGAEPLDMPEAMPQSGNYNSAISVTLSSKKEGAKIYYTLDGSDPVDQDGKPTSGAKDYADTFIKQKVTHADSSTKEETVERGILIDKTGETVLKAVAVADGYDNSETLIRYYTILEKPEAAIDPDDLELLNYLYIEDGMCLDDLTMDLPDGFRWDEDVDVDTPLYYADALEDPEADNNEYAFVYVSLVYNPDPKVYSDTYLDFAFPIYRQCAYIDVINGAAFDSAGGFIFSAQDGETVYLVADYDGVDADYVFDKWIVTDEDGNPVNVTESFTEEEKAAIPAQLKDPDDGSLYDGVARFRMTDKDVLAKATYVKYKRDKDKPEEDPKPVKVKNVASLEVTPSELKLKVDDEEKGSGTLTISAQFEGEGEQPEITVKSTRQDVAAVEYDGTTVKVTALKEGESVIWVSCGDKVARCAVEVAPSPVEVKVEQGKAYDEKGTVINTANKGDRIKLAADDAAQGKLFEKWEIKGANILSGYSDTNRQVLITAGSRPISAAAKYIDDPAYPAYVRKHRNVEVKSLTVKIEGGDLDIVEGQETDEFTVYAEYPEEGQDTEIEFAVEKADVLELKGRQIEKGRAAFTLKGLKFGNSKVYVCCGNRTYQFGVRVLGDGNEGFELVGIDNENEINMKAGEQKAVAVMLLPEKSTKQVASVKYKILGKDDKGNKLPKVATVTSKGLITAKWDTKLPSDKAASTILQVTVTLAKEKGQKKAAVYTETFTINVEPTAYETDDLKKTGKKTEDKGYSLSVKGSVSLDMGISGKESLNLEAILSGKNISDKIGNYEVNYVSTNNKVVSVEGNNRPVMDPNNKKAKASYKLRGVGIGTAYVLVTVTDSTNKLVNRMMTKVTVKSSNPGLALTGDSAGLMSLFERDENGNIKLDPNNSVTISMKEGQYDRLYIGLIPEQSTDAGALSYSASGGVSVKNGVVYARKETKKDKPAKVIVKCRKSKPITIYVNVVK